MLLQQHGLPQQALFRVKGPVNLVRQMQLIDLVDDPALLFSPWKPAWPRQLVAGRSVMEQMRKGDVLIHALPIFHVHGLFVAIHGALLNGSKMLWHGKFDPKKVIADMPRATVFMGVPTLYVRMLAEPSLTKEQAAHMRLFISGSAP